VMLVTTTSKRYDPALSLLYTRGLPVGSVARQSGWESSDNQDGHFGGRGEVMIVAARR
jgi:hypothetical protein